ncbi:MAG: CPXCG motif-containing cysteine-rich protein [Balneolaceae bacterium]
MALQESPKESQLYPFRCPWCGKKQETVIDPSRGRQQQYREECSSCGKSSRLTATLDDHTGRYRIHVRKTG